MSAWLIVAVACFALAHLVLRSQGEPRRAVIKAAAAVRIVSSAALVIVLLIPLLERAVALPEPVRWAAWLVASAASLFWIMNAAAGLWVLSSFVGADLGTDVVAAGRRGKISAYGVTRLEVSTPAGWSAQLPYWLVALRPLRTSPRGGPCWVELRLRQDHWSDDEMRILRQAAIFSPYRDISSTVTVTRHSQIVTVRLRLTARSPESQVQRQLEQALAEFRTQRTRTA